MYTIVGCMYSLVHGFKVGFDTIELIRIKK